MEIRHRIALGVGMLAGIWFASTAAAIGAGVFGAIEESPHPMRPLSVTLLGAAFCGAIALALFALGAAASFSRRTRALLAGCEQLAESDRACRVPLDGGDDELTRVAQSVNHIAERWELAERQHKEALSTLRDLIEASPVAIVGTDAAGRVGVWNRAAERLLGWSATEVIGQKTPHVPEDKNDEHESMRERVLAGASGIELETRRRRKDGSEIDVLVRTSPIHEGDSVRGIITLLEDIGARKQEEVRRAARLASERRAREEAEAERAVAERVARRLRDMQAITDAAVAGLTIDGVLRNALGLIAHVFACDAAMVLLLDETGAFLVEHASRGFQSSKGSPARVSVGAGVAGRIALRGEPLAVDADSPDEALRDELREAGLHSVLGVPMRVDGRLYGVVKVACLERRHFGDDDVRALLLVGDRIAMLIEHARFYDEQRRLSEMLESIGHAMVAVADLHGSNGGGVNAVLRAIVESARAATGARYAALGVGSDPKQPFSPWVASGVSDEIAQRIGRSPRPVGTLAQVAVERVAIRATDVRRHPAHHGLPPGHPEMGPLLALPIVHAGRGVGNLFLANAPGERDFTDQDQRAIALLSAHAGVCIENVRLYHELANERARLALLADAGGVISGSLDYEATLRAVAHAAVPSLADYCIVDLVEGGVLRRVAAAGADTAAEARLGAFSREPPRLDDEHHPIPRAIKSGRSELIPDVSDAVLASIYGNGLRLETARAVGARCAIITPLSLHGRPRGAMMLLSTKAGRFDKADVQLAEELARRAALSIENARLYREAQQAVRAREEILAIVSHDLKNPLTSVRMGASVIERRLGDDPAHQSCRKQAAAILRAADRMRRLVGDLLLAARIDSGGLSVERSPQPLAPLVAEAVDGLRPVAAERRLDLAIDLPLRLPPVLCDGERVVQVIGNLVHNAIKFSPTGARIEVAAQVENGFVRCSVRDEGGGIAPDQQPRLFDRFWQARETARRGSGLGLYIVKEIVVAHGGTVGVDSRIGAGSRFWFTLPVASSSSPGAVDPSASARPSARASDHIDG